jgi:signal transduction histidine kinase
VQEALAAAGRRHAGHASVLVRYAPDAVELDVTDDGHGERELLGIRERVALYGGKLTIAPDSVRARIPVEAA